MKTSAKVALYALLPIVMTSTCNPMTTHGVSKTITSIPNGCRSMVHSPGQNLGKIAASALLISIGVDYLALKYGNTGEVNRNPLTANRHTKLAKITGWTLCGTSACFLGMSTLQAKELYDGILLAAKTVNETTTAAETATTRLYEHIDTLKNIPIRFLATVSNLADQATKLVTNGKIEEGTRLDGFIPS